MNCIDTAFQTFWPLVLEKVHCCALQERASDLFVRLFPALVCLPIHHYVTSLHATRPTRLFLPHLHSGSDEILEVEKAWEQGC